MQQTFRRQLLALRRIDADSAAAEEQCRGFIRSVLKAKIEARPETQGVRDVLTSMGTPTAATDRFADAFDAAVWHHPARAAGPLPEPPDSIALHSERR